MKASLYLIPALACAVWSLKTDVAFKKQYNEVDIGVDLYSCDDYMKLYDKAADGCLSVGCSATQKACDKQACVAIDGTTNEGVDDKFKDYLKQLRDVVEGSCKEDKYYPSNSMSERVRVQIPVFLGTSTAADDGDFVANYKVTYSSGEKDSTCQTITTLVNAGLGTLPGGSLFGSTSLLCQ